MNWEAVLTIAVGVAIGAWAGGTAVVGSIFAFDMVRDSLRRRREVKTLIRSRR